MSDTNDETVNVEADVKVDVTEIVEAASNRSNLWYCKSCGNPLGHIDGLFLRFNEGPHGPKVRDIYRLDGRCVCGRKIRWKRGSQPCKQDEQDS